MISPLHQFSLTQLIIGALFIVFVLAAVQHWALRRLNAEPGDEMENAAGDKASEILGDTPVRSKVGTPRPRRLQPLRAGEEEPAFSSSRSGAAVQIPADSLAMAGASALAKPSEGKPAEPTPKPTILPPLVTALGDLAGGAKKPEPAVASADKPREAVALPPLAVGAPAAAEATGGPLPAVPSVSLAPATGAPQAAKAESDDVKKRKILPSVPVPEQKADGLVTSPKAGETVAGKPPLAPAEPGKAIEPPPAPKPEPAPKTGDRPRIFLPANLPATAAKPAGEPVPVPAIPAVPAVVEAKTPPAAAVPAKPVEPISTAIPAPGPGAKPEAPAVPVPPVAAKSEPAAPASQEAAKTPTPVVVPPKEEKAPVPPLPVTPTPAPVPVPTAGKDAKAPATAAPDASVPPPLPKAAPKEAPVRTPQPTMAQNETTTDLPANSRASAQLTLGFEVTSLQLTPFFKLGGVQLKSLSNVASLHLIATQSADNPLAAGISFEVESVELNESSHIRSILLKPFQGVEPAAVVPQGKLQVDAIQIASGDEGAPISVTSGQNSTVVQMLATFSIASMEFTPAFEIGALRLEPTSNSVLLRLSPSSRPTSLDLPPSFEVANVQLSDKAQLANVRLTPGGKPS